MNSTPDKELDTTNNVTKRKRQTVSVALRDIWTTAGLGDGGAKLTLTTCPVPGSGHSLKLCLCKIRKAARKNSN